MGVNDDLELDSSQSQASDVSQIVFKEEFNSSIDESIKSEPFQDQFEKTPNKKHHHRVAVQNSSSQTTSDSLSENERSIDVFIENETRLSPHHCNQDAHRIQILSQEHEVKDHSIGDQNEEIEFDSDTETDPSCKRLKLSDTDIELEARILSFNNVQSDTGSKEGNVHRSPLSNKENLNFFDFDGQGGVDLSNVKCLSIPTSGLGIPVGGFVDCNNENLNGDKENRMRPVCPVLCSITNLNEIGDQLREQTDNKRQRTVPGILRRPRDKREKKTSPMTSLIEAVDLRAVLAGEIPGISISNSFLAGTLTNIDPRIVSAQIREAENIPPCEQHPIQSQETSQSHPSFHVTQLPSTHFSPLTHHVTHVLPVSGSSAASLPHLSQDNSSFSESSATDHDSILHVLQEEAVNQHGNLAANASNTNIHRIANSALHPCGKVINDLSLPSASQVQTNLLQAVAATPITAFPTLNKVAFSTPDHPVRHSHSEHICHKSKPTRIICTPHPKTGQLMYLSEELDSPNDTHLLDSPDHIPTEVHKSPPDTGRSRRDSDRLIDFRQPTPFNSPESPLLLDKDEDQCRAQHNIKERRRRARVKEACNIMRKMVPGISDKTDKATVFEFAARYIHFLKGFVGHSHDKEFLLNYSPY